jgi:hypothetical protein
MQHAADDAMLTDHVDEHRSDNWASYGALLSAWPSLPDPLTGTQNRSHACHKLASTSTCTPVSWLSAA